MTSGDTLMTYDCFLIFHSDQENTYMVEATSNIPNFQYSIDAIDSF